MRLLHNRPTHTLSLTMWFAMTPDGRLANLGGHVVVEHVDGSISVSPSILVSDSRGSWHGFLVNGVWSV